MKNNKGELFQFLNGAIKRAADEIRTAVRKVFQFLNGAIKSEDDEDYEEDED